MGRFALYSNYATHHVLSETPIKSVHAYILLSVFVLMAVWTNNSKYWVHVNIVTVASQQDGPGWNTTGASQFGVCMLHGGGFPPNSKNMQIGWIGKQKLPIDVNVSVNEFVCLYISALWWTGDLSRVNPGSYPVIGPRDPEQDKQV